jgi:hypothetical protein
MRIAVHVEDEGDVVFARTWETPDVGGAPDMRDFLVRLQTQVNGFVTSEENR